MVHDLMHNYVKHGSYKGTSVIVAIHNTALYYTCIFGEARWMDQRGIS